MTYEKKEADGSILHTGYSLKFYYDEHEEFPDLYGYFLTQDEARAILERFKALFPSIEGVSLYFQKGKTGGTYSRRYGLITLGYNHPYITLGILSHEVAHAIDHAERGKTKHDRYMYNILRMVMEKARGIKSESL